MIDAKELRIGNYLTACLTKELVIVDWLVIKHIQDNGNVQAPLYDMNGVYRPIPLTEEWLIKLGFMANPDSVWERDYKWDEYILDTPIGRVEIANFNGEGFLIEQLKDLTRDTILIKSVHQLQNILYCTIGMELTINKSHG
jgi:hypothetical protein